METSACRPRTLNKANGVTATVNLSTERAHITAPAHLSASNPVAAVEAMSYSATMTRVRRTPAQFPPRAHAYREAWA